MKTRVLFLSAAVLLVQSAWGQKAFAPVTAWESAVKVGNAAALTQFYAADAALVAGKGKITVRDDVAFWSGFEKGGITKFLARLLELQTLAGGNKMSVVRLSITSAGKPLYGSVRMTWAQQGGKWKIVAASRAVAFEEEAVRTLPQPAAPNVELYSDPKEAEAELQAALRKAGQEKKRVIVVFGGNWCYDCHVLDTTFHSKDFAALVDSNFVVVHINVGEDGQENHAMGDRLGVALDKGVPSLGVLEADGKVVYAQKNGEFEATEKIGPKDVRAFLEKWKPAR